MPKRFTKAWKSYSDQLSLITSRGIVVNDTDSATRFLSHVGYYRFTGYCLAFENGSRNVYVPNTTIEQIEYAYDFDHKLRDLLNEGLEVVEVDLRTSVAYYFGEKHGCFGHTKESNFFKYIPPKHQRPSTRASTKFVFDHAEWLEKLRDSAGRSKERFIKHFRDTYLEFPDLPIWVATEVMSFGWLSQMVEGMRDQDRGKISARYGIDPHILANWTHHLSVIRNACAHHARVWDKTLSVLPSLPRLDQPYGKYWRPPHLLQNDRISAAILVVYQMLKKCQLDSDFAFDWKTRVSNLLKNLPNSPRASNRLGLSQEWDSNPLWSE